MNMIIKYINIQFLEIEGLGLVLKAFLFITIS